MVGTIPDSSRFGLDGGLLIDGYDRVPDSSITAVAIFTLAPTATAPESAHRTVPVSIVRAMPVYREWSRNTATIRPDGIGYLRLEDMDDRLAFLDKLVEFHACKSIIIDVRGNRGMNSHALRQLASLLMPPRQPPFVYYFVRPLRLGEADTDLTAGMKLLRFLKSVPQHGGPARPGDDAAPGTFASWFEGTLAPAANSWWKPGQRVVVLMDGACYGGIDLFLMTMKEIDGVTLMGRASSGGSNMSQVYTFAQGELAVRLSHMISLMPDGTLLDGNGVQPDVVVTPIPTDFITGGTDTTLDAAVRFLMTKEP